jgi:hypothetical protein
MYVRNGTFMYNFHFFEQIFIGPSYNKLTDFAFVFFFIRILPQKKRSFYNRTNQFLFHEILLTDELILHVNGTMLKQENLSDFGIRSMQE